MTAPTPTEREDAGRHDGHRSRESDLRSALSRHFRPLWASESTIVEAVPRGVPAELASITNRSMPLVRAGFIETMLAEPDVSAALHPRGIVIRGARIMGHLRLDGIRPLVRLALEKCAMPRGLSLEEAHLRSLSLKGSRIGPLVADGARVEGSIRLGHGLHATGMVRFTGAQIGGDAFLGAGIHATGVVRFLGSNIGGDLVGRGGRFDNPGDTALGFDRATVAGGVFLDEEFHATGQVRFLGAQIGGALGGSGGRFDNPGKDALSFDRASIAGNVFLDEEFHATGQVRFLRSSIGGDLVGRGGRFDNPGDTALGFDRATVAGNAFLDVGLHATGEVRFPGAHVGGQLSFRGAHLENPGGNALCAPALHVGGVAIFDGDAETRLVVEGNVILSEADVAESVKVDMARLVGSHFDMSRARIARTLIWHDVAGGVALDMSAAKIGLLDCQDRGALFRGVNTLWMDVCEYDQIKGLPGEHKTKAWVNQWLAGIERTRPAVDGFSPAPYRQLERVLGRSGHTSAAKRVAIARENAESASGRRSWYTGAWRFVCRIGVGYGYRPERALYCLFAAYLIGCLLVWELHAHGGIVPQTQGAGNAGGAAPSFDAFVFTAYALLPLVNLGQQDVWEPATTTAQAVVLGLTIIGWFLSTLGLLAVTGFVRADRDRS